MPGFVPLYRASNKRSLRLNLIGEIKKEIFKSKIWISKK
jgi:hypothetical protein